MTPAETAIRAALEASGVTAQCDWKKYAPDVVAALAELLAELDRLRAERKPLTSGDRLWLWQDGDRYLAFRHEFPCYSPGGDPMTLGNPAPVVVEFQESHDRASGITGD